MSDGGWTKQYRRQWVHPVFRNFRDAAIWSYLTNNAAWADNTDVRFNGFRIMLSTGQIATSERVLAEGFCCDRQVIRRIFDALEKDLMITREKTRDYTIITICNYKTYQENDQEEKPTEPAEKTHLKPTSNPPYIDKTSKNSKNEEDSPLSPAGGFERFWNLYPNKIEEPAARKAFAKAEPIAGIDAILAGVTRYVSTKPPMQAWKKPAGWLRGERWNDQPAPTTPSKVLPFVATGPKRTYAEILEDQARQKGRELTPMSSDIAPIVAITDTVRMAIEGEIS